jgi:hypothetical protein
MSSIQFTGVIFLIIGLFSLFVRLFLMNDSNYSSKEEKKRIELNAIKILSLSIFFLVVGLIMFCYSYYIHERTSSWNDLFSFLKILCFLILINGIYLLYYKENIFLHIKSNGLNVPKDFIKYRNLIIFIGIIFVIIGIALIIWYYAIPFLSKYYLLDNN